MKTFFYLMSLLMVVPMVSSCTLPGERPRDPKTPWEQLLTSHAIERSLSETTLGIPEGTSLVLDASGLTADQRFMGDVVAGWLGQKGFVVQETEKEATYRVQLIIQSVGTEADVKIIGVGGGEGLSNFIGIRIPELAIYKSEREEGVSRFYMRIFDAHTGAFISSTPSYEGSVHRTKYTLLFVIKWQRTDLVQGD
jgi:hypothetical protein